MSMATTEAGLPQDASYARMVGTIADPLLRHRPGRRYWIALLLAFLATLGFAGCVTWLFVRGIGIYGNNTIVVWGFPIANYVWWIGIGNAGTLISALLLLTRQSWRASINRFAEAMTLIAASIAGLFPILHLGRPYRAYWLAPYPNTMELWPQWRSALVWDFAAIAVYLLFSLFFWYLGLIPDLATLRDRARGRRSRLIYGVLAFGWRGSARHWQRHDAVYKAMAALAVPLVVSVHSVVGLDFAASLMPGWQETIFPPYFVVGALFSGFAMVVTLAVLLRWGLGLQAVITDRHFDAMGKILLAGAIVMGLSYATEWFMGWYAGDHAERELLRFEFAGPYAPLYWAMLACNVLVPQLLWFRRLRTGLVAVFTIAIAINIGMWLERILIIWNTLSHGYLPSTRRLFHPTIWDWATLAGSFGLFAFLFLALVRLVPAVAMHDVNKALYDAKAGEA
ncbi:NrfD/PsrC family molybdoenzyme membrane anchor subunit [Paracraurococcus lichenis]|uniref:NrfD/PsrC family molybdoenzyme membrane anchor subunit n=1 Tax=Paracraurococcus lichenis TaxID=3064888 RepID=A0ABT9DYD8_9PROT|nr:NrfD/PsrC family molybdoenzyme membrane anchor subunit [Paracraurococcus sp. LOR1-02]MDO9708765.1 NrfD/PsrC family molybdoenzyme membrane anchor subunit [Paracraurococcus sp. LOR1-02]